MQSSSFKRSSQLTFSTRLPFVASLRIFTLLGYLVVAAVGATQVNAAPVNPTQQPTATLQAQSTRRSEACVEAVYQNQAQAIETCQQAITLTQLTGDQRLEAYSLGNLGTLQLQQHHYTEALTLYSEALQVAQSIADPTLEVKAWIAIGTAHTHLDQLQAAQQAYQQALTVAQAHQDQTGTAVAHYNLGLIEDQLGNYAAAIESYRSANQVAKAIDDVFLEVYAANKLQLAYEKQIQIGQAP